MHIQEALEKLLHSQDLLPEEMESVMRQVMTGDATPAQIGGFLIGLRMKGESVDEVASAAAVMRSLAASVPISVDNAIDIVGTGGDATSTFNVSTCSAIVAAAAGAKVAKHGNRSVSSQSGAADLLETAGVNINLKPEEVQQCVEKIGVGFMFAPLHHSAMKHAIGPRREMGVRTIFNLLGPLTNPAGVRSQLLGVYDSSWVFPMAKVLKKLGSDHVIVVHGQDGMDEISVGAPTTIAHLRNGDIEEYTIEPESFGMQLSSLASIQVSSAEESLAMIQGVLSNAEGAARDIVVLNAGAALCCSGVAADIADGVAAAKLAIENHSAEQKFQDLIALSQTFKS